MKFLFIIFLSIGFLSTAFTYQSRFVQKTTNYSMAGGIKFSKMSFEKAKKQAKSSGKLIFIDVFTTWCGPCKEMSRTTFQSSTVGNLFNSKFINLKLDAENDVDGIFVSEKYSVTAYPTLLFINGEGKIVKKLIGKQSEEKLLSIANSLN